MNDMWCSGVVFTWVCSNKYKCGWVSKWVHVSAWVSKLSEWVDCEWMNWVSEWKNEWVNGWVSLSECMSELSEWVECEGSRELSECTIQSVSARTSWFGIDVSHLVEIVWITLWSVNGETNLDNKLCRSMHTTTENETWHDYYKSIKLIFTSLRLPSTLKVWICQDI